MSPGMLIVSPRMLALAATQRQVARLLLGIDLTTVQHGPLPVTNPRSLKIRIMGRGFRVRSAAAVASTSLPALRDRTVGV